MDRDTETSALWWIVGIAVVLIALWAAWAYFSYRSPSTVVDQNQTGQISDSTAVSRFVGDFGGHLQNVSLLSPDASSTIASEYGSFVTPTLLAEWQSDSSMAPGRQTSSPWPDHVEISDVVQSGSTYTVTGDVIYMTSTGVSGREQFTADVAPAGTGWVITSFRIASSTSS